MDTQHTQLSDIILDLTHKYDSIEEIQSKFIEITGDDTIDIIDYLENLCKSNKDYLKILIRIIRILNPKPKLEEKFINPIKHNVQKDSTKPIILSEEQQSVIDHALSGHNIFLSGQAGTGKSCVIKHLIKALREKYFNEDNQNDLSDIVGVTSLTGCSAVLINGSTIHSFLKIGLARNSAEELYIHTSTSMKTRHKFNKLKYELKVLIIDEVSMMDLKFFEKISDYLKLIKNNILPFGGVQIILSGDFHQLCPVEFTDYIFNSNVWKQLFLECIVLTKSFRQEDDIPFQELLNNLRIGNLSEEDYKLLSEQKSSSLLEKGFVPVKLFSTNSQVDGYNNRKLEELVEKTKNPKIKFAIKPTIGYTNADVTALRKQNNILNFIELIEGAQVMLTFNINTEAGLVNGTMGVIKKISRDNIILTIDNGQIHEIPYINCNDPASSDLDNPKVVFQYLPIRLAYAISIHKSQGQSISLLEIDLSNTFGYHMGYVAVSRCKSLDGLIVNGLSKNAFKTDKKVIEFYESIKNN